MKLQYNGTFPVDIPGREGVNPGDVIDLPDDLAASLLLAGHSIEDGKVIASPDSPVWTRHASKTAAKAEPTTEPADAGKES